MCPFEKSSRRHHPFYRYVRRRECTSRLADMLVVAKSLRKLPQYMQRWPFNKISLVDIIEVRGHNTELSFRFLMQGMKADT